MFLTKDDINRIKYSLIKGGIKDSELPKTDIISEGDFVSIVQNGENKRIALKDLDKDSSISLADVDGIFLNLTSYE